MRSADDARAPDLIEHFIDFMFDPRRAGGFSTGLIDESVSACCLGGIPLRSQQSSCSINYARLCCSGASSKSREGILKGQGGKTMRVMIRFALPVEASNTAARTGKLEKVFKQIHEDLKPEAAYFFAQDGQRGGLFIVDMQDSSQIADFAERFFFGLNAKVEF